MSRPVFTVRLAAESDFPALESLIPLSVRALQARQYTAAQMDAALGPVFGVDRQLIRDGTYYVAHSVAGVVGCGGWSRRRAEFGSDRTRAEEDVAVDPRHDPARIRAFFVHPGWVRLGIGKAILFACESAARAAGFRRAVLVATLTGEPLYAACGYVVQDRFEISLPGDLTLPVARMSRSLQVASGAKPLSWPPDLNKNEDPDTG
ncbi:MAG TPA: GNAT family N-acetyltransferase [Gemmata sp.]|jgi:GNAT superfamily N-acetyltransferase|nr:GNAT family N-acetyltransferase [Gemmata sp.]